MRQRSSFIAGMIGLAAAAGLMPAAALAQYRTPNSNGHALDASNQVGSGGFNQGTGQTAENLQATGNQIINGDVTGLFGFRGNIPYRDPTLFQGFIPFQPSLELQRISGVSSPSEKPTYGPHPFYAAPDLVRTPPNFVQVPGTGTVVPAPPPPPSIPIQDTRLGNPLNLPELSLALPGDSGSGPVDVSGLASPEIFNNSSPLYGDRDLSFEGANSSVLGVAPTISAEGSMGQHLSTNDILRLRQQLNQNLVQPGTGVQPSGAAPLPSANIVTAAPSGATPLQTPVAGAVPLTSADLSRSAQLAAPGLRSPLVNGLDTGQSSRQTLPALPTPAQQTARYADLRKRLDQYNAAHPQSDEEANRNFQAQLRLRREFEQQPAGAPGAPAGVQRPDVGPTLTPVPTTPAPPQNTGAAAVQPLPVGPVATSVQAPGLHDLLAEGEDLSHRQQFKEAIGKFRDAQAVAPNNPLILMDLANAELGAGFYGPAEQDIRGAFSSDAALLMGTYDLKQLIGDDRLQVLIGDLKDLANKSNSQTPVFLLAYLSYNTGDAQKAVDYLDLAQARAGGQDDLIRQLHDHWALPAKGPASQPAPEMNK
jgi:hypothetical protein